MVDKNTIKLSEPIKTDDVTITEITLREPRFSDLDGIPLDKINDAKYLRILVSRISGIEIMYLKDLPMTDALKLFGGLSNFFQSSTETEA